MCNEEKGKESLRDKRSESRNTEAVATRPVPAELCRANLARVGYLVAIPKRPDRRE